MRKHIFITLLTLCVSVLTTQAQNKLHMGEFDPYISEYFKPMANGIATGMNSGWVTTAKAHNNLGFDINLSFTVVNIPSSAAGFSSNKLSSMANEGYYFKKGSLDSRNGNEIDFPNIRSNDKDDLPSIYKTFEPIIAGKTPTINFEAIYGLNTKISATASIQLTVGLPKKTDLIIRFFPDISGVVNSAVSRTEVDMRMEKTSYWGLGVKHDIKQWIPGFNKVPFLQLSALFTYSNFYTGFSGKDLTITPQRFTSSIHSELPDDTWQDQKFTMDVKGISGTLLFGANIPVFQPFVGIGFNTGIFNAGLKGTYPIIQVNTDKITANEYQFVVNKDDKETNPITVNGKNTEFNFIAGARLKLGFFILHYQFSKQNYSMHTAGLAFTFR